MKKTHELKTWPEFFDAIARGEKTFELRKDDDRGFHAGDRLRLREWLPVDKVYTGREMLVDVPYLIGGKWGLERDYVCMSIRRV